MTTIRRFTSFEELQTIWVTFEQTTFHYPFQSFWYQKLFAQKFCETQNLHLLGVYSENILLAIGGFEKVGSTILLIGMKQVLGGQDITDYGDLLWKEDITDHQATEVWETIITYFQTLHIKQLQLDFVREDSRTYNAISSGLPRSIHNNVLIESQEVSPYIEVSSSWDEYVTRLERKQRHELKRKIKRFEEQHAFHFCSNETIKQDFDTFIQLHRMSDQTKEKFMSEPMRQFFWDIVTTNNTYYRIDFCFLKIDNHPVASIMSFIGKGKALIYNSGFDPAYRYYSVGLILHAYLIKKSIEEKLTIHDFLRGNERYKYDLGAINLQLYRITFDLPILDNQ